MKPSPAQQLQKTQQALAHERAMREVLQLVNRRDFPDNRSFLDAAASLRGKYSVHAICDALAIPRGTFYNHVFRSKGADNAYARRDARLKPEISRIFHEHLQRIGAAKIAAVLRQSDTPVTARKVRSLMKELGLKSVRGESKAVFDRMKPRFPNLVRQNFTAEAPNRVWTSDVTEFEFKGHRYYICAILDLFSRKAVAHRVSLRNSTHLVLLTLRAACRERHPPKNIVFHSDRGSPYTSFATRRFCRDNGMEVSYSRPRAPTDNAVSESFFNSLKAECLYRCGPQSARAFLRSIDEYFAYYNSKRPHQAIGFLTPDDKDKSWQGGSES